MNSKPIKGIPVYVIDNDNDAGVIYTLANHAGRSSYGRLTYFDRFTEIPDFLTANDVNILDRALWKKLMSKRESYKVKDGKESLRLTVYGDYSKIPSIVLQTDGVDVLTSKNYHEFNVVAFKKINRYVTNFSLKSLNNTLGYDFQKKFDEYANSSELVSIFNSCMSSLVDEKLTENLSFLKVESIPDFDELELRINGSGRTVFLLSPAVLKIHDFFGGKVQLDELTYRRMFSDY